MLQEWLKSLWGFICWVRGSLLDTRHVHCPHDVPSGMSPLGLLGSAHLFYWRPGRVGVWRGLGLGAGAGPTSSWSSCPGEARFLDIPAHGPREALAIRVGGGSKGPQAEGRACWPLLGSQTAGEFPHREHMGAVWEALISPRPKLARHLRASVSLIHKRGASPSDVGGMWCQLCASLHHRKLTSCLPEHSEVGTDRALFCREGN